MSFDESEKTNANNFQTNQGPRIKHPVQRRGICRCLCYTLTVSIGFISVVLGVLFVRGPWVDSLAPHKHLYQEFSNAIPNEVVRPLIEEDQKFDIVATVWIRDVGRTKARGKTLVEKAIFTDTLFRGIKMSDKNIRTSVNLEIPTGVFKDKMLADHDLRGSFLLIPNSPSPLDNVLNYSSWIPTAANPPSRTYPVGYARSLADEVVDAYGTFTPLLSFHNVESKCQHANSTSSTPPNDENWASRKDREEFDPYAMIHPDRSRKEKNEVTTKGKQVLEAHPYIITRTHLNIMDMTKLYNREAYEVAHKLLAETECGELSIFGLRTAAFPPDWRLCDRSFASNGNHEVMIQYSPGRSQGQESTSHWAYAPYLFVDQDAWGPLDLVPVPVNREKCGTSSSSSDVAHTSGQQDSSVLNITWDVSFGSISPRSSVLIETMSNMMIYRQFNMTDNEQTYQSIHSKIDFIQSLFGPDFDQKRQSLLIGCALLALVFLLSVFGKYHDLLYWYNRAPISTVGVSIIGAKFSAGGALLDHLFRGFFVTGIPFISWDWAWELFYESLFQIIPLLKLRAVARTKFIWSKKIWIFTVPVGIRFAVGSHAERTSERVEKMTSWRQLIFFILSVIFCVSYINDFHVIAPKIPRPAETLPLNRIILLCQSLFVFPMMTLGWILQIVMNFRSKTFAGMDKLAAYSGFLSAVAMLAAASIYNNLPVDDITLLLLFEMIAYGIMALQALVYPTPSLQCFTSNDD